MKQSIKNELDEFKRYYLKQTSVDIADEGPPREERLRVSGFPYCALQHAYKRMNVVKEPKVNFDFLYYTQNGTLTHSIVQDFAGRGGQIYGAWKCLRKGCRGKRKFSAKNKCPKCGHRMEYEELTVKAFNNLTGHLDGVWRNEAGEWFVVDYKTCSTRIIYSQSKRKTLPYHHNVCQIKAYCALVEQCFNIKISGWILMYVARDTPQQIVKAEGEYISDKAKRKQLKMIHRYDQDWDRVLNLRKFKELWQLVKEKPCASHDEYLEKFDQIDPCPLSRGGICFNKGQLKDLLKITWSDRPQEIRFSPKKTVNN